MTLQRLGVDPDIAHGGDRVVFLHGVGSDATVWQGQLRHFADRNAVAFDMPGYRGSPPTLHDDAAGLAGLVLAAIGDGPGRLHLVGLSLGAVVAAHVAARAGARVASLTLASGFLTYPEGAAVARRAREAAAAGMAQLAAARIDRILHPRTPYAVRQGVLATLGAIPVEAYQRMSQAVWTADLTDVTPHLRAPTLVISGADDPVTPVALGRELARSIPAAHFETVPQASHLVNLDQPGAFEALVRRHVEAHP